MGKDLEAGAIHVSVFGMSDVGRVRKNNEDNLAVCNLTTGEICIMPPVRNHAVGPRGTLMMVADGMGGEASGEVASQICTTTVPKRLYENLKSLGQVSESNFVLLMREAVEYANQIIFQKAQSDAASKGMGTTTTAAAVLGPHLFVGQVGDSRAYLVRNRQMVQLTRDQTFLSYLEDIGAELPADPEKDSRKSILTQAVGSSESVDVKVTYTPLRQGDAVLLCSDGLYNMASGEQMRTILAGDQRLPDKCRALVACALEGGGADNITVILAQLDGSGLPPADPAARVECKEFQEEDFKND